jgi:hypothetical protein
MGRRSIQKKESEIAGFSRERIDKTVLKGILSEYIEIYQGFDKENERKVNQLIFGSIVSHLKGGEPSGDFEILIRGDGLIKKTWDGQKAKENQVRQVRTPGSFGSAGRTRIPQRARDFVPIKSIGTQPATRSHKTKRGPQ